ncbi:MAG: oxygen-independent coproporphyrinogen III oxidase [Lachnospiraceae bacterium]|nr:oxygen-independent coproporphyrinogen III oxidase [Lachnospiraceae bacterium]
MNRLSLYLHIPFCVKKCHYCDFLSAPCKEETRQEYVEVLCMEIVQKAKLYKDKIVDTIFFGGGTPSLLSAEQMKRIMETVRQEFRVLAEAEISMEVNPGTVSLEKLKAYKEYGINRLSIGLQSANNEELRVLGRIHTWEVFENTWKQVRELDFSNVNIDLMSALPGQTLESYESTLRKVLALKPEHISAYSLIIEEGTQFYEWFGEDNSKLPDEITDRRMYEMTRTLLEEYGYHRYEISNYALKGYECKHNVGYWKRKDYLGLGLGAASLLSNVRSSNVSELAEYLKLNWRTEKEELSIQDQMEEFMFLGLRMMEGISCLEFEQQFGKSLKEVYGTQIAKLEKQGLLRYHQETDRYALTLQGIDVSNQVFVEFID